MLKYFAIPIVLLLVFGAGYGLGAQRAAGKVEYRDRIVEREKESVNLTQKVDMAELVKQITHVLENRKVATTRTITREGGKEVITERIRDLTSTTTQVDNTIQTLTSVSSELKLLRESLRLEEHYKVVSPAPRSNYRLGVNVGYDMARLWGRGSEFSLLPVPGLVAQVQVERRLFGSLFATAWAQTTGVAGLGLNLEW